LETSAPQNILTFKNNSCLEEKTDLIMEEPLSIRIQGKTFSVLLRTPGEEQPHAAGFCLSEGIIDGLSDIAALGYCDSVDPNVIAMRLNDKRAELVSDLLSGKTYISQTSCGICGQEMIRSLGQNIVPFSDNMKLNPKEMVGKLNQLPDLQPLRKKTRAVHAAAICGEGFDVLSVSEDVGRHNALDKAIGKLLLADTLKNAKIAVMSSRISYELVQKASRAGIPVIIAISRPTALAVKFAEQLNMTLACLSKGDGIHVFTGKNRLKN